MSEIKFKGKFKGQKDKLSSSFRFNPLHTEFLIIFYHKSYYKFYYIWW